MSETVDKLAVERGVMVRILFNDRELPGGCPSMTPSRGNRGIDGNLAAGHEVCTLLADGVPFSRASGNTFPGFWEPINWDAGFMTLFSRDEGATAKALAGAIIQTVMKRRAACVIMS